MPITRDDFDRINKCASELRKPTEKLFRVLSGVDDRLNKFSHSLEKRSDGRCEFLTEENRCQLHQDFGIEMKPSMCQLFPYTFTSTPSGTYASISFASTAALLNAGLPLCEQRPLLETRFDLFKKLFGSLKLDWSNSQLIDGTAIGWPDYLKQEHRLFEALSQDRGTRRADRTLFEASQSFRNAVPASVKLNDLANMVPGKAKTTDQILVKHLLAAYFPQNVFNASRQIDARQLLQEVVSEPTSVSIEHGETAFQIKDIAKLSLGALPEETNDLLYRFVFCRIFAKLYFGPGFNFLSVIAGLHHLSILVALVRIRVKLELLHTKKTSRDLDLAALVMETVRTLERSLTVAIYSQDTTAMLEVFLASPDRVERIISLAA
ncbi:MAG: hypothetical protein K2Z81_14665 [Cyanobacteria bacterium]|nr:hypothetical protein [Cyanobacteriota bacterium]